MSVTSKQIHDKKENDDRNVLLSFMKALDKDRSINETIASIESVSASGLTITGPAITTVARRLYTDPNSDNYVNVPAGKAITFLVEGGTAGNDYTIIARIVTSGGQTIERNLTIQLRAS